MKNSSHLFLPPRLVFDTPITISKVTAKRFTFLLSYRVWGLEKKARASVAENALGRLSTSRGDDSQNLLKLADVSNGISKQRNSNRICPIVRLCYSNRREFIRFLKWFFDNNGRSDLLTYRERTQKNYSFQFINFIGTALAKILLLIAKLIAARVTLRFRFLANGLSKTRFLFSFTSPRPPSKNH